MSGTKTRIEWADRVLNPVTGCSPVSAGCDNCFAARMAKRLAGRCGYPADQPFRVTLHPDRLSIPRQWRKPQRVFVNSMSDLFHDDVPDEFIDRVFAAMALTLQHTYMILTKRPERMKAYLTDPDRRRRIWNRKCDFGKPVTPMDWPLANVWLGVSAENQATADERIPLLLQTPAAIRFVSCEPLLGPVDLNTYLDPVGYACCGGEPEFCHCLDGWPRDDEDGHYLTLDWVIAGGESGPGARPMHPDWACSLRDQCALAGVPFFFKQWGEWVPCAVPHVNPKGEMLPHVILHRDGTSTSASWSDVLESTGEAWAMTRLGKRHAGRQLDDREHLEFPLRQC